MEEELLSAVGAQLNTDSSLEHASITTLSGVKFFILKRFEFTSEA
jgi:hypothetical protein